MGFVMEVFSFGDKPGAWLWESGAAPHRKIRKERDAPPCRRVAVKPPLVLLEGVNLGVKITKSAPPGVQEPPNHPTSLASMYDEHPDVRVARPLDLSCPRAASCG